MFDQPIVDLYSKPVISIVEKVKEEPKKPEPKLYTIKEGDNLTKIAEANNVPLSRLWAANPELTSPDLIEPNKPLKIPQDDEVLPERPLPAIVQSNLSPVVTQTNAPSGRSSVSGNTYIKGYCTWYAKNMRPDLPNNLGNAASWYARYTGAKGSAPRVGAIGQRGNHVVYITGVSGNTVTYSEMNGQAGWNRINSGSAPASDFLYLY